MKLDEEKWEQSLVVNKLKCRVLKMVEIQQVYFGKLGADEVENSADDDKGWGNK